MVRIRKKRAKKSKMGTDDNLDIGGEQLATEEELAEMLDMEVGEADVAQVDASEMASRFEMLEGKVARIETVLESVRKEGDARMEAIENMRKDFVKLMSVYELVSQSMNPFVDPATRGQFAASYTTPQEKTDELEDIGAVIGGEDIMDDDLLEVIPIDELELDGDAPPEGGALPGDSDAINISLEQTDGNGAEPLEVEMDGNILSAGIENGKTAIPQGATATEGGPKPDRRPAKKSPAFPPLGPENPLLKSIKRTPENIATLLKWIEFLMSRIPRDSIEVVLEHYVSTGWISEDVRELAMLHARGQVSNLMIGVKDGDCDMGDWRLPASDHLKSLLFIIALGGGIVEDDFRTRMDSMAESILGGDGAHGT